MKTPFTATRQIGIDMGHRVTNHGSKCRNLHGHRYTIEATIKGDLIDTGASEGMVMDFGFLKEEMMQEIDEPCDHGLCLWSKDPLVTAMSERYPEWDMFTIGQAMETLGWYSSVLHPFGKVYILDSVPTAENLARHWFYRLAPVVAYRSEGQASLINVRVYETPNCWADYTVAR